MGTQSGGAAVDIRPPTVGLNTDVRVSYRPVTSQGLSGMQTKPLGPGRQIADKSYWLKILRDKVKEISTEIKAMQDEKEKITRNNASQVAMERRYEETIKEVRSLEGKLADFNLALDKLRTNTDITEIKDTHDQLKFDNERDRKQIDELFVESKRCHEETARMEAKIQQLHKTAAEHMETLGPEFQREYEAMNKMNLAYKSEIEAKEDELESLDHKIQQTRASMKSDDYKTHQRGIQLTKRLEGLNKQEAELLEETRQNLSPEEMKQKQLKKLRAANADMTKLKKQIKKAKAEVNEAEDKVDALRKDIDEAKKIHEKSAKYDELYKRDDRITSFIDGFPEAEKKAKAELAQHQRMIVALMSHISKGLAWEGSLKNGEAASVNAIKQELTFKEKQNELSQDTLAHSQAELKKRRAELKKIETLSEKISVELESLEEKKAAMLAELESFQDPEQLQAEAKKEKRELAVAREATKAKVHAIRQLVEVVSQPLGRKMSMLKKSDLHRKIQNLEKTLSAHSQSVQQLSEGIESRKRDSQYDNLLARAIGDCEKVNAMHVARLG